MQRQTAKLITILVSIPCAYAMARSKHQTLFLFLVIIPFWTNSLIRIFAWMSILNNDGILNQILMSLHITKQYIPFLYNTKAVILVSVYMYIPYAILPIFTAVDRFDFSLIEAARDLGATKMQSMLKILIPGIKTMSTFSSFIDNKDPYTRGHSQRVANYTREMIKRMGYSPSDQQYAYYAGLMHDIGKITIKDEVLNKTTRLSTDEWEMIQKHTTNGAELLKNFTILPLINDAVLYHHERYDGNGYINRLKGENIPLIARVVCIADSYDAMATNRCYRLKFSEERIIKELERCAGKQFDPDIVPVMISIIADGTIYKL